MQNVKNNVKNKAEAESSKRMNIEKYEKYVFKVTISNYCFLSQQNYPTK